MILFSLTLTTINLQGNTYHQPSQNPNQYNTSCQQSHDFPAVEQRDDPYRQRQPSHPQNNQSYPSQQSQPSYQQQYSNVQLQSTPVGNHPQPIYQRQHSQSQGRQSRSRITPGRMFPNPDPCFMKINKPAYLQPAQLPRAISPSTSDFAGGVVVNTHQQYQPSSSITGYANGGSSPQYKSQSTPNYQQQSQPSPNHYQQPQSPSQYQYSPQHQSSVTLPLSHDPNRSLPGWSPVRKPVQVSSGYTMNNQCPSAEPYIGQSFAANQVYSVFSEFSQLFFLLRIFIL